MASQSSPGKTRCPACGQTVSIDIVCRAVFRFVNDSISHSTNVNCDDTDAAYCPKCNHAGVLKDFKENADGE